MRNLEFYPRPDRRKNAASSFGTYVHVRAKRKDPFTNGLLDEEQGHKTEEFT